MSKNYKKVNSINLSKGCTLTTNCITLQDGQTAKIIVENGKTKIMIENKEVKEEEPKFKKGDILSCTDGKATWYVIFKDIDENKKDNRLEYYCMFYCDGWLSLNAACDESGWNYATEEEKRTLFVAMLNKGLFFDEKKMKVRTLKDGDIIMCESTYGNTWYSIFKEIKDKKIYSYSDLNSNGYLFHEDGPISYIDCILSIRYSTTEERQTLFNKIEEQEHKKWNVETKKFEKIRWRAKEGEIYWFITEYFDISCHAEEDGEEDEFLFSASNYFQTKELAEAARDKIKELLSKL